MSEIKAKKIELYRNLYKNKLDTQEIADRLPFKYRSVFLRELQKRLKSGKKLRIYSDGCWDMFHYGHARQFEQIKALHPNIELVVGVCSAEDILKNKGSFVMNDEERIESVRHCHWVDEVLFPAPWTPTLPFIESLKIDFIAHDAIPYLVPGVEDCYSQFKEKGRFLPTIRTDGISTSDILVRIIKERDSYAERNLKKGYSRKQLNLGIFDYLMIRMRGEFEEVKRSFKKIAKRAETKIQSLKKKTLRKDSDSF